MKKPLTAVSNTALIALTLALSSHFVFAMEEDSLHENFPDRISLSNAALNPGTNLPSNISADEEIGNISAEEFLVNPKMNAQELSVKDQNKTVTETSNLQTLSNAASQKKAFSVHSAKRMTVKALRRVRSAVSEKISDALGSVWAKFFDNENARRRLSTGSLVPVAYQNGKTQNFIPGEKRAKFNLQKYRETSSGINSQRQNEPPPPSGNKSSATRKWAMKFLALTELSAGAVFLPFLPYPLVFLASWALIVIGNMIGPRALQNALSKGEKPIPNWRLYMGRALMIAGAGGYISGLVGLITGTGLISAHAAASALPFDTTSSQASRTLLEWLMRGAIGGGLIASAIDLAKNFLEKIPSVSGKLIHAKINWIALGLYLLIGLGLGAVLGFGLGSFAIIL